MTSPLTAQRPQQARARWTPLLLLPLPLAWFAYVLAYNPTDNVADLTGPCTWHALFGIDGPACGITRMTWYLLHGDLVNAARMHLAALIAVPILAYAYLWWVAGSLLGRKLPTVRIGRGWILGYIIFFFVYAVVLRNLPWAPFTWFYVPDFTQ